jgi:hypothetical protein
MSHHGFATSGSKAWYAAVTPSFTYAQNSGWPGFQNVNPEFRYYLYAQEQRERASEYGFVYLVGSEKTTLEIHVGADGIKLYRGGVGGTRLSGMVSVIGGYSQYWKKDEYYLDPVTSYPRTGFLTYNGSKYYMGSGGCMEKAFFDDNGIYQYFRKYGDAYRYYTRDGAMATGPVSANGEHYLLSPAGNRLTGFQLYGGHYYMLGANGRAETGRFKIGKYAVRANYTGRIGHLPAPAGVRGLKAYPVSSTRLGLLFKRPGTVSGYQIQASTSKSFAPAKTKTLYAGSGGGRTRKTAVTGLSPKKNYYVRVRAYRSYHGVKSYGRFSAAKKVKTVALH